MQKFKSVDKLVNQLKPTEPVYCIRRDSINIASKFFQNKFPGKILYAVKTNPHPLVLKTIVEAELMILISLQLKKLRQLEVLAQMQNAPTCIL
jgi:ornithine decarboxylase